MNIWACYFISFIPLIAALILWFKCKQIVWWESTIMVALGLITSLIFNFFSVMGMTSDVETWSGQITESRYQPSWQEYYEEAIYRTEHYTTDESYTDSNGNLQSRTSYHTRQVFSHWEPRMRWHSEQWDATDTLIGNFRIEKSRYDDICAKFGKIESRHVHRRTSEHNSRMIGGDSNDYYAVNVKSHVYPRTDARSWKNKIKAAPSVFSYSEVPEKINVFDYPKNSDRFTSDRIMGPTGINTYMWDQLNAELGPVKGINLIIVNFGRNADSDMAEYQESKWIGGKKNDLVICCGGGNDIARPTWVTVFGWTDSELVKQNIQSLVYKYGLLPELIPHLKQEVIKNYQIKDWSKFDYLTVEIPFHLWVWMIVTVIVVTGSWTAYAYFNKLNK